MKLKFITDEPALNVGEFLVLTDIHIGMEFELFKSGINLPTQTKKLKKRIIKLLDDTDSEKLVILGDLTHQVPGISWQERKEIPKLIEDLSKRAEIHLIKGNHDGELETLLEDVDVNIYSAQGFVRDGIAFSHGNTWPSKEQAKAEKLIMGHIHPTIEFDDHFGFRMVEKCWVRAPVDKSVIAKKLKMEEDEINLEEIIVEPVFNPLIGGVAVNKGEGFMGPLMEKCIKKDEFKIYMLDGTDLGHIKA